MVRESAAQDVNDTGRGRSVRLKICVCDARDCASPKKKCNLELKLFLLPTRNKLENYSSHIIFEYANYCFYVHLKTANMICSFHDEDIRF